MDAIATVGLAYLLGCVNGGYYLVRFRTGKDLREMGSGTLGARNTGRALGRLGFAVAMVWDALKGVVAVSLANLLAPGAAPVAAVAVVLGHLLPIQLGLRGGKGLATSLGAVAVLAPVAAGVALGVAAVLLVVTRRGPLSALTGVAAAPVTLWATGAWSGEVAAILAVSLLVLARHADPLASLFRAAADGGSA